ncbi:Kinesin-like protein kif27 [Cichlidogyrus casuarinus]|uniref:Kinesin-like protein kif27 n=1 Tax=Cichlidogyrus casuarinus TaxID=1844966 RepID=A0ABD2PNZ6_9PLAT
MLVCPLCMLFCQEREQLTDQLVDVQKMIDKSSQRRGRIEPRNESASTNDSHLLRKRQELLTSKNRLKQELQKSQKTLDDLKQLKELLGTIERMKREQVVLQNRLKAETDHKLRLEKGARRDTERIKSLEMKTEKQEKVLKRKQEEIKAANRRLRKGPDMTSSVIADTFSSFNFCPVSGSENNLSVQGMRAPDGKGTERLRRAFKLAQLVLSNYLDESKKKSHLVLELKNRDALIAKRDQALAERSALQMASKRKHRIHSMENLQDDKADANKLPSESNYELERISVLNEAIEALNDAIKFQDEKISERDNGHEDKELDTDEELDKVAGRFSELDKDLLTKLCAGFFFPQISKMSMLAEEHTREAQQMRLDLDDERQQVFRLKQALRNQSVEADRQNTILRNTHELERQALLNQLNEIQNMSWGNLSNDQQKQHSRPHTASGAAEESLSHLNQELNSLKQQNRDLKKKIREWVASGRLIS